MLLPCICAQDTSTTSNYYASFIWWLVVEWSCALILCAVVLQWTLPLWFLLSHYYNCLLKCPILIVSLLNTILTVLSICFSLCVPWASHVLITTTAPVRRIIGASLSELIMTITHAWGKFVFVCVCVKSSTFVAPLFSRQCLFIYLRRLLCDLKFLSAYLRFMNWFHSCQLLTSLIEQHSSNCAVWQSRGSCCSCKGVITLLL